MNLWGWKFRNQTKIDDYVLERESSENESKRWANWQPTYSYSVLMLVAYSDDGDDINEVVIPRSR